MAHFTSHAPDLRTDPELAAVVEAWPSLPTADIWVRITETPLGLVYCTELVDRREPFSSLYL